MAVKDAVKGSDVDERLSALLNNAAAVRAVQSAVEGTIGPKGLDVMLIDRFGDIVVTNDGVSILSLMEAAHPAARMVINVAKAQENEVGDGTTTATLMAGTLIDEAVNQISRGVPVPQLLAGVRRGLDLALSGLCDRIRLVEGLDDRRLYEVALIASRGREDIARLVWDAARVVGETKLREPGFQLMRSVLAKEGATNEVFSGVILDQRPLNRQMPFTLSSPLILCLDDALEAEEIETEALSTEAGLNRYLALQDNFETNLQKLVRMGVRVVFADRGVSDVAEELLTDAGVLVIARMPSRELAKVAEHTGARLIKRTSLKRPEEELAKTLGTADVVSFDERLEQVRIAGGKGAAMATVLVGAATEEIVGERERVAKDAAAALQSALRGGVVPGGGAVEIALAREVEVAARDAAGMDAFGLSCVSSALKRPLAQICANAGFSPLEKVEAVRTAQAKSGTDTLGVDCDSGEVADLFSRGIVDPAPVKAHAIRAAGDVAEAILRINVIIKKRETQPARSATDRGEQEF